jgi:peptidyl-prolyl cis-trans isomerase C
MRYFLCILLVSGLLACGDGGKLASVDGRKVSGKEFDAYLKLKHIDAKDEKRRKALLEQYLQREALAEAIEKTDLLDKAQVAAEVNEFRKEVLISRYFDRFMKEQLSDEAVEKYYKAHLEEFTEKQVHAAHILIRTHSMMSEEQRQAMLARVNEIRVQIKDGKTFAEMAEKNSQDKATAAMGGDLGWIRQEAMGRQFSDAAFKLPAGEISEPVETPFGYHLITVLEPPRSVQKPLSAVAGRIRHTLKTESRERELERLLASVKVRNNL